MSSPDFHFLITIVFVPLGVILVLFWVFGGFGDVEREREPRASDGAVVARICKDGTYLWRYVDGSLHTSWGSRTETNDPTQVCE